MTVTALVRRPGPRLPEGLVDNSHRIPVDTDLALTQWRGYVAALESAGWRVVEAPPADDHPDAVFIEDAVVAFGNVAVTTHPGAESRRGEVQAVRALVQELGLEVTEITAPATLDGGDVLAIGRRVYVGRSQRTNDEAIRQLRTILLPRAYEVIEVPITGVLHLKTAVTALPDGAVIGLSGSLADTSVFGEFVEAPEAAGAAVVVLGEDSVLVSAAAPQTAQVLRERGLHVVTADISEFEKLEGGLTCLSVRLRELLVRES